MLILNPFFQNGFAHLPFLGASVLHDSSHKQQVFVMFFVGDSMSYNVVKKIMCT